MEKSLPFTAAAARRWTETVPTPFYVYDAAGITAGIKALKAAFSWNKGFREYFAVKATPTPGVLRLLTAEDCGTDCASVPELTLSRAVGLQGDHIVLTSNETSPEEYRAALAAGAIVNFDDLTQIDLCVAAAGVPETVCVRYNPGEFRISNAIIGTLKESKFGMPEDQLTQALARLKALGAKRFGVHGMLASCSLDPAYYPELARVLFSLAVRIKDRLGIELSFIDLSGGIGIPYKPEEKPVDIVAVGAAVRAVYAEILTPAGLSPALYTELGRWATGPHGYLITSVIGHKHTHKEYVGVDATACCLMRPAIYGAYHHITVLGKETQAPAGVFDVVGSLCENNDKFAVDRPLPETKLGDLLAIHDAGAHGRSMGYNYNGKLRPAEYLLRADGFLECVRRAETQADLFATLDADEVFTAALSRLAGEAKI